MEKRKTENNNNEWHSSQHTSNHIGSPEKREHHAKQ